MRFLEKLLARLSDSSEAATSIKAPIKNAEYQSKRNNEIKFLEQRYDLSSVAGINAIPIPKKKQPSVGNVQSVTGQIEYYLFLKGSEYEKAGKVELALACYRKANQLMPFSSVPYQCDYYLRLPRYLRKLRRFEEARLEESRVYALFPDRGVYELPKDSFLKDMKEAGHTEKKALELYKEYQAECAEKRNKLLLRDDYDWVWEYLSDICPKSFSAYMRARNENSDKFKLIIARANRLGKKIK